MDSVPKAADCDGLQFEEMIHNIGLMHADLAGEAGGEFGVQAPVDQFLPFGIGRDKTPAGFLVPLSPCVHGLADRAGAHEREHELSLRFTAVLQARLEIDLRIGRGRFGNGAGILHGAAERRLAVDMLAGLERGQSDLLVIVRRGGNHYPFHILVLEQVLKIIVAGCLGMLALGAALHGAVVIGHGD